MGQNPESTLGCYRADETGMAFPYFEMHSQSVYGRVQFGWSHEMGRAENFGVDLA